MGRVGVNGAVGYDDLLETVAAINKPEPEVRTSDVAVRRPGATTRVGWLVCSAVCGGRWAVGGVRCYLGTTLVQGTTLAHGGIARTLSTSHRWSVRSHARSCLATHVYNNFVSVGLMSI
jgi:hypothetical protein